jgi:hypothetical protein
VGGSGTIGKHLIPEWLEAGHQIINLSRSAGGHSAEACYFEATSTATQCVSISISNTNLARCHLNGGISNITGNNSISLHECILRNAASDAVLGPTNGVSYFIRDCTIRNPGRDGIRLGASGTAAPAHSEIIDNLFHTVGGYGINNVFGTDTNQVFRSGNVFYSMTSGEEAGFGDSPNFGHLTEGSDPHVSSTNLALVTGASGRAVAYAFERLSTTVSYFDHGAVQHQDSGGGTGGIVIGA